jgi:hypothetical protein
MSSVRYELGFYIPEDGILPSHFCENLIIFHSINLSRSVAETSRFL